MPPDGRRDVRRLQRQRTRDRQLRLPADEARRTRAAAARHDVPQLRRRQNAAAPRSIRFSARARWAVPLRVFAGACDHCGGRCVAPLEDGHRRYSRTRAPALIAKISSSILVSFAVGLAYLTARRRRVDRARALFIAVVFGLGTDYGATASQTLWQHETSDSRADAGGVRLTRPGSPSALPIGVGLGLAASSRLQVFPAVFVFIAAATWLGERGSAAIVAATLLVLIAPIAARQLALVWHRSRGRATARGAAPDDPRHPSKSFRAAMGRGRRVLLLSPNRGLLIYGPVIALAAAGLPPG